MTDQKRAGKSAKSVQDLKMLGHFSKSDIRYWQGAIFRQTYTRNGRTFVTKDWAMKVAHEGRRETFPLGTPNKAAAAARARDIYLSLVAVGWEPTLARFKKLKAAAPAANDERQCTVGEFLDAVAEAATNRSTVEGYAKKFRQIVSEIFGLSDGDRKHDYQKGGLQEWLTKVHSVHLSDVTPSRVQQWKRSFLAKAGSDPVAMRKLRISVNSMLRQARSLFSPKRIRHLRLSLPAPLPFEGVEFEPRQSMKYRSEIDIEGLIKTANDELRDADPEAYKIFLLGVAVGLRRKEIDLLEWSSFHWRENIIRIEPTRYFHPKSEDSIADIPVDAEVMNVFQKCYVTGKGVFVIKSKRPPFPNKPQQYYRCDPIIDRLNEAVAYLAQGVRLFVDSEPWNPRRVSSSTARGPPYYVRAL